MTMPHAWKKAADRLADDIREVFGPRLRSIVIYDTHFGEGQIGESGAATANDSHVHALVVTDSLTFSDLMACASHAAGWSRSNIGTPLFLTAEDLRRSLDAFPLELNAIRIHHELVAGSDPFDGLEIDRTDLRRACEMQVRSHLIHLREGLLETEGHPGAVARLVVASVPSFSTLLLNVAHLDGVESRSRHAIVEHATTRIGLTSALLEHVLALRVPKDLAESDALRVYAAYLDGVERLAHFVDGWGA